MSLGGVKMYINNNRLKVRRYSSGELKFVRSDMDKLIVDNRVEILYVGGYTIFELLLVLKYYKKKNVLIDLVLDYCQDYTGSSKSCHLKYCIDATGMYLVNSGHKSNSGNCDYCWKDCTKFPKCTITNGTVKCT